MKCWGANAYGQLGNGSTDDATTPRAVIGIAAGTTVEGSSFHACAVVAAGAVRCWGLVGTWLLGGGHHRVDRRCPSRSSGSEPTD